MLGGSQVAVQQMLGHATASMTLDLYGHLFPGQLDDVADRLEVLGRAAGVFLRTICGLEVLRTFCGRALEGLDRAVTRGYLRGPGRARTDDSRGVNAVLYQLSYRPRHGDMRRPHTGQVPEPTSSSRAER